MQKHIFLSDFLHDYIVSGIVLQEQYNLANLISIFTEQRATRLTELPWMNEKLSVHFFETGLKPFTWETQSWLGLPGDWVLLKIKLGLPF